MENVGPFGNASKSDITEAMPTIFRSSNNVRKRRVIGNQFADRESRVMRCLGRDGGQE